MSTQQPSTPSQTAQERVLALLAAYEAGQVSQPDAEAAMALAVFAGKTVASRLADITISTLTNLPPLGILPGQQHLDRLTDAVSTVMAEPEGAAERLSNLTDAEVMVSKQKTTTAAIREQGFEHWREEVSQDACEVCLPYAGRLHKAAEPFEPHHPRCRCSAVPVGKPTTEESAA